MGLEIPVSFTLDSVCPWTYVSKRRLGKALAVVREKHPDVGVTVRYLPFQLSPDASEEGVDKYEWYRQSRYGDSEEKMQMYKTIMSEYGEAEGINFKFGGVMANTLHAHRIIHHFQEAKGPEVSDKIINGLYRRYFEEEKHPSSPETLLAATTEAGVSEAEAKAVIDDKDEGLVDVKMLIREQRGNGIDSVPYIVIEGKRRDFTLVGAKEVEQYVKAIEQCIKESS